MKLPHRTSPIIDSNREYIDRSTPAHLVPIVDLSPRPSPLRRFRDWIGAEFVPPNNPPQIQCWRWSPEVTRLAFWVATCSVAIVIIAFFALR